MKFIFALLFTTSLAAFTTSTFTQYLLLNNFFGNDQNCRRGRYGRRRCSNNLLSFAPFLLPTPTPAPAAPPGCFPDSANFERLTATGDFELVHAKDLNLGDQVKCLKAPRGPLTEQPEVGACKFVARQHSSNETITYHTVGYVDNGVEKFVSMSPWHMMWAAKATGLDGVVAAKDIKLDSKLFLPIEQVQPGDYIIAESNHNLQYHQVTSNVIEKLEGINEPAFLDGGLPFVNGVLATTTSRHSRGGHWGNYFRRIWFADEKFADPEASYWEFVETPLMQAEAFNRGVYVDNECFLNKILADQANGVDISNFNSYDKFAAVYIIPCSSQAK